MANLDQIMDYIADNTIVDQGTSGDWEYRKWSDGTAECWGQITGSSGAPSALGGFYGKALTNISFPSSLFTNTPRAFSNCTAWGSGYHWSMLYGISTSSFNLAMIRNDNNSGNYYVDVYAIGKWK